MSTNSVFNFIKLPGTKRPYAVMRDHRIRENWEELMAKSREEVEELLVEWKESNERNQDIRNELAIEYKEKMKEVESFFESLNIDIFKYKKKGYFREKNGYVAWFEKNVHQPIKEYYPLYTPDYSPYGHTGRKMVQGVEVSNGQSPTPLLELYDRLSHQIKREKEKESKELEKYTKAVIYATEERLDILGLSQSEVISMVNEHAKNVFIEENLKNGTEIHQDYCDECSSYTVGENRCECGNVRLSAYAEGNFIDGFYEMVEPY